METRKRELAQHEELYNAIYRAIKEKGTGMEITRVREVLNQVMCDINVQSGRQTIDTLFDKEYFSVKGSGE